MWNDCCLNYRNRKKLFNLCVHDLLRIITSIVTQFTLLYMTCRSRVDPGGRQEDNYTQRKKIMQMPSKEYQRKGKKITNTSFPN